LRTAGPGRRLFVPKSVRQPAATLEKEFFPAEQPTILLVHGFWGGAAHWGKVILALSRKGHQSICAVENPLTSLADDAERPRKMIAQQKGPGALGRALLWRSGDHRSRRHAECRGTGLYRRLRAGRGRKSWRHHREKPAGGRPNLAPDSDGYLWVKSDKFHASFCQDLTANEALVMAVTQKAPVASTFENPLTAPAWKKKPSWYQISSDDRMIAPANQEWMPGRLGARKVIKLKASHASLASMPEEVSALIDEVASAA